MPELKIGIQLAGLRMPLRKALQTAARLGADAVELDARGEITPDQLTQTALREIRRMLDDLELKVSAVSFQTRRGYDVAQDLERRVIATKAAMNMARALGTSVVVNQIGRVPDSESAAWSIMVEALTDLGLYGQRVGALLTAQTGAESGAELARLLAALPQHAIAIDLDPALLVINGHSPLEAVEQLGPSIVHVHARDAVRDLARGRGLEVELSRGAVDFPALLGALEEHDYRGYFTVGRQQSQDPVADIGNAVKYLRSL